MPPTSCGPLAIASALNTGLPDSNVARKSKNVPSDAKPQSLGCSLKLIEPVEPVGEDYCFVMVSSVDTTIDCCEFCASEDGKVFPFHKLSDYHFADIFHHSSDAHFTSRARPAIHSVSNSEWKYFDNGKEVPFEIPAPPGTWKTMFYYIPSPIVASESSATCNCHFKDTFFLVIRFSSSLSPIGGTNNASDTNYSAWSASDYVIGTTTGLQDIKADYISRYSKLGMKIIKTHTLGLNILGGAINVYSAENKTRAAVVAGAGIAGNYIGGALACFAIASLGLPALAATIIGIGVGAAVGWACGWVADKIYGSALTAKEKGAGLAGPGSGGPGGVEFRNSDLVIPNFFSNPDLLNNKHDLSIAMLGTENGMLAIVQKFAPFIKTKEHLMCRILQELQYGLVIMRRPLYFSLHFAKDGSLYSVLDPVYQQTVIGYICGLVDIKLKSFVNGGFFPDDFILNWDGKMDTGFLRPHLIDIHRHLSHEKVADSVKYRALCELDGNECDTESPKDYFTAFRIVMKLPEVEHGESMLRTSPCFDIEYDINPLPHRQADIKTGKGTTKKEHEAMSIRYLRMKREIEKKMPMVPAFTSYFDLLNMIVTCAHYVATCASGGLFPQIPEKYKTMDTIQPFPDRVPPLPIKRKITVNAPLFSREIITMKRFQEELLRQIREDDENSNPEFVKWLRNTIRNSVEAAIGSISIPSNIIKLMEDEELRVPQVCDKVYRMINEAKRVVVYFFEHILAKEAKELLCSRSQIKTIMIPVSIDFTQLPADFDPKKYVGLYPDLSAKAKGFSFEQIVRFGREHFGGIGEREGRTYSVAERLPDMDPERYLLLYPDLKEKANSISNTIQRRNWIRLFYIQSGVIAGEIYQYPGGVYLGFDAEEYLAIHSDINVPWPNNPEFRAARINWARVHYLTVGEAEGRCFKVGNPSLSKYIVPSDFDPEYYLQLHEIVVPQEHREPIVKRNFARECYLRNLDEYKRAGLEPITTLLESELTPSWNGYSDSINYVNQNIIFRNSMCELEYRKFCAALLEAGYGEKNPQDICKERISELQTHVVTQKAKLEQEKCAVREKIHAEHLKHLTQKRMEMTREVQQFLNYAQCKVEYDQQVESNLQQMRKAYQDHEIEIEVDLQKKCNSTFNELDIEANRNIEIILKAKLDAEKELQDFVRSCETASERTAEGYKNFIGSCFEHLPTDYQLRNHIFLFPITVGPISDDDWDSSMIGGCRIISNTPKLTQKSNQQMRKYLHCPKHFQFNVTLDTIPTSGSNLVSLSNYNSAHVYVGVYDYDGIKSSCRDQLNSKARDGTRPIDIACVQCDLKMLDLLLELGVPVETAPRSDGLTTLLIACQENFVPGVKMLLTKLSATTSILDAVTDTKVTCLHWAVYWNSPELARMLLQHGANPNLRRRSDGLSPADLAAQLDRYECFAVIVACNRWDSNVFDSSDRSCIHHAATVGNPRFVYILKQLGHSLYPHKDRMGFTPSEIATNLGYDAFASSLGFLAQKDQRPMQTRKTRKYNDIMDMVRAGDSKAVETHLLMHDFAIPFSPTWAKKCFEALLQSRCKDTLLVCARYIRFDKLEGFAVEVARHRIHSWMQTLKNIGISLSTPNADNLTPFMVSSELDDIETFKAACIAINKPLHIEQTKKCLLIALIHSSKAIIRFITQKIIVWEYSNFELCADEALYDPNLSPDIFKHPFLKFTEKGLQIAAAKSTIDIVSMICDKLGKPGLQYKRFCNGRKDTEIAITGNNDLLAVIEQYGKQLHAAIISSKPNVQKFAQLKKATIAIGYAPVVDGLPLLHSIFLNSAWWALKLIPAFYDANYRHNGIPPGCYLFREIDLHSLTSAVKEFSNGFFGFDHLSFVDCLGDASVIFSKIGDSTEMVFRTVIDFVRTYPILLKQRDTKGNGLIHRILKFSTQQLDEKDWNNFFKNIPNSVWKLTNDNGATSFMEFLNVSVPLYEVVKRVCKIKSAVLGVDNREQNCLHYFLQTKENCMSIDAPRITELLLENCSPEAIYQSNIDGETPWILASRFGSVPVCALLARAGGFSVLDSAITKRGTSAIHEAVENSDDPSILRYFVAFGGSINRKTQWGIDFTGKENYLLGGDTPLHFACKGSSVDMIREIIDRGGDLQALNNQDKTPYHIAASESSYEVFKILSTTTLWIRFAAHGELFEGAAMNSDPRVLQLLCNQRNPTCLETRSVSSEQYPLVAAASCNMSINIETLIYQGVSILSYSHKGNSAVFTACKRGNFSALQTLIRLAPTHIVDINSLIDLLISENNDGDTTLHAAAQGGCFACMQLISHLITYHKGNQFTMDKISTLQNFDGHTPFSIAVWNGYYQLANMIWNQFTEIQKKRALDTPREKIYRTAAKKATENFDFTLPGLISRVNEVFPGISNWNNTATVPRLFIEPIPMSWCPGQYRTEWMESNALCERFLIRQFYQIQDESIIEFYVQSLLELDKSVPILLQILVQRVLPFIDPDLHWEKLLKNFVKVSDSLSKLPGTLRVSVFPWIEAFLNCPWANMMCLIDWTKVSGSVLRFAEHVLSASKQPNLVIPAPSSSIRPLQLTNTNFIDSVVSCLNNGLTSTMLAHLDKFPVLQLEYLFDDNIKYSEAVSHGFLHNEMIAPTGLLSDLGTPLKQNLIIMKVVQETRDTHTFNAISNTILLLSKTRELVGDTEEGNAIVQIAKARIMEHDDFVTWGRLAGTYITTFGAVAFNTLSAIISQANKLKHISFFIETVLETGNIPHKSLTSLPSIKELSQELLEYRRKLLGHDREIKDILKSFSPNRSVPFEAHSISFDGTPLFPLSKHEVKQLKEFYELYSAFNEKLKHNGTISLCKVARDTALAFKNVPSPEKAAELLAILGEGMFKVLCMKPFTIQILCVVSFLLPIFSEREGKDCSRLRGRMAQVATGEGKGVITSLLTAFYALQHFFVDVISSNQALAIRDSKEFSPFYEFFGLSCSSIAHHSPSKRDFNYAILYGTNTDFEFALMQDNIVSDQKMFTERNGTLVKREREVVVVDESDSLFLDKALNSARIAHSVSRSFAWAYRTVYESAANSQIPVLALRCSLESQFPCRKNELLKISDALLGRWIQSAFKARNLVLNEDYVISQDRVIIVDKDTGRLSENSRWSNGLHEMVEIKHNIVVESENCTISSISHPSYFDGYEHVYAITGTAGEPSEREEIEKMYAIDSFDVPPHRPCLRKRRQTKVFRTKQLKWEAMMQSLAYERAKTERPWLILLPTIRDCLEFSKKLEENDMDHFILTDDQDADESFLVKCAGMIRSITIATNAATRGIDVKLCRISLQEGGLHVMIGFLPNNLRVECQALGRSGRQGQPGSNQIFIDAETDDIDDVLTNYFKLFDNILDEPPMEEMEFILKDLYSKRTQRIEAASRYRFLAVHQERVRYHALCLFFNTLQHLNATFSKPSSAKVISQLKSDPCADPLRKSCSLIGTSIISYFRDQWAIYFTEVCEERNNRDGNTIFQDFLNQVSWPKILRINNP